MSASKTFADTLSRGREGDPTALEELFARWRPVLRLQADQLLGAELAARADASDVVQEAFAQAFMKLDEFRGTTEGEWINWLRCIVAGKAANLYRQHSAECRATGREESAPTLAHFDGKLTPERLLILKEDDARLARAIANLPPDLRAVVVERVFQREPFEVVARRLGRSNGAARVLWTRALRKLRDLLAEP